MLSQLIVIYINLNNNILIILSFKNSIILTHIHEIPNIHIKITKKIIPKTGVKLNSEQHHYIQFITRNGLLLILLLTVKMIE